MNGSPPQEQPAPLIDNEEYPVLRNTYDEWVRLNKYMATCSFAAIGFTIALMQLGSGNAEPTANAGAVRISWLFLGASGLLSGLSIAIAYSWIDIVNRMHAPTLTDKFLLYRGSFRALWWLTRFAWLFSIVSAMSLMTGLVFVILHAWSST